MYVSRTAALDNINKMSRTAALFYKILLTAALANRVSLNLLVPHIGADRFLIIVLGIVNCYDIWHNGVVCL